MLWKSSLKKFVINRCAKRKVNWNCMSDMPKSEDEWKQKLSPEEYIVLREKGTEPAFSGKYYHSTEKGMYLCAACGQELFSSDVKYDSGSGWPSFWQPVDAGKIATDEDVSLGMSRVEVKCNRCGSHLGHVFEDGPNPTGKRFCINSLALKLSKNDETKNEPT